MNNQDPHNSKDNMMKPEVLVIGQTPPPIGGVSIYMKRLLASLKEDKISIRHLSPKQAKITDFLRYIPEIRKVHLNLSNPYAIFLLSALYRLTGKYIIITIHGELGIHALWRNLLVYMAIKLAGSVLVLNKVSYNKALRIKGKDVYLTTAFIPPMTEEMNTLNTEKRNDIVCFVGKYTGAFCTNAFTVQTDTDNNEVYGIKGLLEIFRAHPEYCLIVSNPTGTYLPYLKEMGIVIPENVKFITYAHSFLDILNITDCFLRATTTDGDSVTIHEAIWLKKPVIASDCVNRPEGCYLYRKLDWTGLEERIVECGSGTVNPVYSKSKNAYELVRTLYQS